MSFLNFSRVKCLLVDTKYGDERDLSLVDVKTDDSIDINRILQNERFHTWSTKKYNIALYLVDNIHATTLVENRFLNNIYADDIFEGRVLIVNHDNQGGMIDIGPYVTTHYTNDWFKDLFYAHSHQDDV